MATYVYCNDESYMCVCKTVKDLSILVGIFKWLIDAYVSDFYTLKHWDKLPRCLQRYFQDCSPPDLTWLLSQEEVQLASHKNIPPLLLLSLHRTIQTLSLQRAAVDVASEKNINDIYKLLQKTNIDLQKDGKSGIRKNIVAESGVDRNSVKMSASKPPSFKNGQCLDMYHIFRKHVKPKKQHEIQKLGETISSLARLADCKNIVDVGAGLGHLSRVLKFKHNLEVVTVEAADGHAPKAAKYDHEMKREIQKVILKSDNSDGQAHHSNHEADALIKNISPSRNSTSDTDVLENTSLPCHVVCHIEPDIGVSQFTEILSRSTVQEASSEDPKFVLAGLHACGDLTPTLLRVFSQSSSGAALASVACCYHKMSALSDRKDKCEEKDLTVSILDNYPMSEKLKSFPNHEISYEAREMACHFADAYKERLSKNLKHLKIHSYRAALQDLIIKVKPDFKSGQVRLVSKKGAESSFSKYAEDNLSKVGIDFEAVDPDLLLQSEFLTQKWTDVVAFYTLRLSLAPAIETLLLLDRMIFLFEKGIPSVLVPIFDSSISPRNFALLALKN